MKPLKYGMVRHIVDVWKPKESWPAAQAASQILGKTALMTPEAFRKEAE